MKILNGVDDGCICLHFDIDARPQFPAELKNHKLNFSWKVLLYFRGRKKSMVQRYDSYTYTQGYIEGSK